MLIVLKLIPSGTGHRSAGHNQELCDQCGPAPVSIDVPICHHGILLLWLQGKQQ